jgi:quinol monooxygenase YgiN
MMLASVEGHVPQESWATLQQAFTKAERPAGLRAGFLIQDQADPTLWRVLGIWISRDAFQAYRQMTPVPGALAIFRAAGVEPTMSFLDIKDHFSS